MKRTDVTYGQLDKVLRSFGLTCRLYEADRGFAHRTHYNTAMYDYVWRAYRDTDPVPLELALDRRFGGLIAQFVEPAEGSDHEAVDRWFDETLPQWLPGSSVANVSSWALHAGGVEDDGLPNDWFVPEADGFPNDWFQPDNNNAPAASPAGRSISAMR